MNRVHLLFAITVGMFVSCTKDSTFNNSPVNTIKDEDYRPLYHFTPPAKWMNDPNGLVFYKGQYHLFYQHNPNASVWGQMNWGHATSTDLFNWTDQPIAIAADNAGTIFSGSVVVDVNNTSGFKSGAEDPLVAIYTINGTQQHQGIAYSINGGLTWQKYASNPVLANPGVPDFRDPKVSWNAGRQKWIMVLAAGNKIAFYSSPDLKSWNFDSEFGANAGAHGGVWECPDLFPLKVEGTNITKWVLIVSINPGGPNGGSASQYFVGDYDGTTFTPASNTTSWVDYGTDNYAGITFDNIPATDSRRIMIGWMSNWNYAQQVPTALWRSSMIVPRELSLASAGNDFVLKSKPVHEITTYKNSPVSEVAGPVNNVQLTDNSIIKSGSYEVNFSVNLSASNLLLTLGNEFEKLTIRYDQASSQLIVDRSASGLSEFNNMFKQKILAPFAATGQLTNFQILVDKTSVELFVNGGEKVITALYFPTSAYDRLNLEGNGTAAIFSNFKITGIGKSLIRTNN